MMFNEKPALKQEIKNGALIIVGVVMTAVAFNLFFVPNRIAPGGVTGLATVLYYLWGLPIGLMSAIFNIPLFLLSWRRLGRMFAIRSLVSMLLMSALLDLLPSFALTADMLLASVIGGALMGAGLGLVVLGNATTGGTDMAVALFSRIFPNTSFGTLLLVLESVIVLAAAFVLGAEVTLYAVVALVLSSRLIDMIQSGVSEGRLFFVISEKPEEIAGALMEQLSRGVTILEGKGAYTGNTRPVLLSVVDKNQVHSFKKIVHDVDKSAFVVLANVTETMGEGFNSILPPPGSGISK